MPAPQDIAGVSVAGVRSDVNVEAFAVANTQEPDHATTTELKPGPERLGGKQFSRPMMNQSKQVQVAGHGRELSPNALQGDEESSVHDWDVVLDESDTAAESSCPAGSPSCVGAAEEQFDPKWSSSLKTTPCKAAQKPKRDSET